MIERGNSSKSEIPEWLQEFRENLVDDEIPERKDSHASSSHEVSLDLMPAKSVDFDCEICQRTNITSVPVQKT